MAKTYKSAFHELTENLSPDIILDRLARPFVASPGGMVVFLIFYAALVVFGAMAWRAFLGFPLLGAIGLAAVLVAAQAGSKVLASSWDPRRWLFNIPLFALVGVNVTTAAAGLAAFFPDVLGANTLERELGPQMVQTQVAVDQVSDTAKYVSSVSEHSDAMARFELAEGVEYQATCLGSAGPGRGQFSTLRGNDRESMKRLSTRLTGGAETARENLKEIRKVIAGYEAVNHDRDLDQIEALLEGINSAFRIADLKGAQSALLVRKAGIAQGVPTAAYGLVVCPDDTLADLIDDAVYMDPTSPDSKLRETPSLPPFERPDPPSERSSVLGLINALGELLTNFEADLSPWLWQLGVAPILDIVFLFSLQSIQKSMRKRFPAQRPHPLEPLRAEAGYPVGLDHVGIGLGETMADPNFIRLQGSILRVQHPWSAIDLLVLPFEPTTDTLDQEREFYSWILPWLDEREPTAIIHARSLPKGISKSHPGWKDQTLVRVWQLPRGFVADLQDRLTIEFAQRAAA